MYISLVVRPRLDPKIYTLGDLQVGECAFLDNQYEQKNSALYIRIAESEMLYVIGQYNGLGVANWDKCKDRRCTPPRKLNITMYLD